MLGHDFQPPPVEGFSQNKVKFHLRKLLDLQFLTIYLKMREHIPNLGEGLILDIGSGYSPWKLMFNSNQKYLGLEIINYVNFGMQEKFSDVVYYEGKYFPFDNEMFDGALCIEVLEHVEDVELMISEIWRVLKKGKKIYISIPFSARRHHIPRDYQRFTREKLEILFKTNHFEIIDIFDRGDEVCTTYHKFLFLFIRNFKNMNLWNFALKLIENLLMLPIIIILNIYSLISLNFQNRDFSYDPLGYFCIIRKE